MFPSLQKKRINWGCVPGFFLLEHFFFFVSRSQISLSLEIAFFFFLLPASSPNKKNLYFKNNYNKNLNYTKQIGRKRKLHIRKGETPHCFLFPFSFDEFTVRRDDDRLIACAREMSRLPLKGREGVYFFFIIPRCDVRDQK